MPRANQRVSADRNVYRRTTDAVGRVVHLAGGCRYLVSMTKSAWSGCPCFASQIPSEAAQSLYESKPRKFPLFVKYSDWTVFGQSLVELASESSIDEYRRQGRASHPSLAACADECRVSPSEQRGRSGSDPLHRLDRLDEISSAWASHGVCHVFITLRRRGVTFGIFHTRLLEFEVCVQVNS